MPSIQFSRHSAAALLLAVSLPFAGCRKQASGEAGTPALPSSERELVTLAKDQHPSAGEALKALMRLDYPKHRELINSSLLTWDARQKKIGTSFSMHTTFAAAFYLEEVPLLGSIASNGVQRIRQRQHFFSGLTDGVFLKMWEDPQVPIADLVNLSRHSERFATLLLHFVASFPSSDGSRELELGRALWQMKPAPLREDYESDMIGHCLRRAPQLLDLLEKEGPPAYRTTRYSQQIAMYSRKGLQARVDTTH